jgi:hypothetical protein
VLGYSVADHIGEDMVTDAIDRAVAARAERERIMADTAEVEPLLRSSTTSEIDTRKPLSEVVDHLAALAGAPSSHR